MEKKAQMLCSNGIPTSLCSFPAVTWEHEPVHTERICCGSHSHTLATFTHSRCLGLTNVFNNRCDFQTVLLDGIMSVWTGKSQSYSNSLILSLANIEMYVGILRTWRNS